ncbi:MAG TPA: D-alanyl-D-alanine carboxypeptidase/D-alanyl-D-alanine-endopeptidase [Actinomycetota bacterium]|nr:D-alanyl-D-alanine carboxypeptidase/D-alanyl-D-alanine-endopeptidase [Actinomycetota bacterium]
MRTRLGVLVALVVALAAAAAAPAHARVPNQTPKRDLENAVSRSLSAPESRGAVAGVLVTRGAATLLDLNGDRALVPASLTKLPTTLAALLRFGPDHRFETIFAGADLRGGTVRGDVALIGGGDPAFSTAAYAVKRYEPDPDDDPPVPVYTTRPATVDVLAEAIVKAGVRRITGSLIVDESRFDAQRTQRGWLARYQTRNSIEVGNLSALAIDEGLGDLEGKTLAPDPAMNAGRALAAALARRGVTVAGGIRHGVAPKQLAPIASVKSPPLREIADYTNKYSVNYPAEMLLKNLGASFGGAGTSAAGIRVIHETLAKIGIPMDGFSITDGSGLSVLNTITPRTIAAVIRYALEDDSEAAKAMRDSLPVAGGPGTLFKRLRLEPVQGNLRGKTGLIRGVRGMAGWVRGLDGSTLVYVTLFNEAASAGRMTTPIDVIAIALARFPYG